MVVCARETSKAGSAIILMNRHFKWGDNSAIFFIFRATPERHHTGADAAAHYHSILHLAYTILVDEIYDVRTRQKNRFASLPFVFLLGEDTFLSRVMMIFD